MTDFKHTECPDDECRYYDPFFDDNCGGQNMENCLMEKPDAGADVPLDRLVSTNKHPDLIAWEKEHKKPLHLGCKVTILETCEYFEEGYDRGKTFIVVMMFVDSGGLNMGLSDGQNDNYLCETDGYYIADLAPA